jgi:serine/threonine protein kinase
VKYAWQGAAGTIFAVKVLRSSMADSVSIRDFRREALLLGRLDHPSIIKMYHFAKLPQPFML